MLENKMWTLYKHENVKMSHFGVLIALPLCSGKGMTPFYYIPFLGVLDTEEKPSDIFGILRKF